MNKHGGYLGDNQKMLDFSININPLGMPESVRSSIISTIDHLGKYPEITGETSIKQLAKSVGINADQLILGNGAIELIYLFAKSLKPQKAMIVTPTFNEYARALTMNAQSEIRTWQLRAEDDFQLDAAAFTETVCDWHPEVIFICNPNNPTAKFHDHLFLEEMIQQCPEDVIWFIDESFIDFSDRQSCLEFLKTGQSKMFLLRSLTKFFGIPGLRIGYGIGSQEIIRMMAEHKEPWTINAFALEAVKTIYENREYIEKTKTYIRTERQRVKEAVEKLPGIKVYESAADFHLYQTELKVLELQKALHERNINIRTCEDFPGLEEHFFRAAIKKTEDNDCFITALTEILTKEQE